jgi:hypothetical protein
MALTQAAACLCVSWSCVLTSGGCLSSAWLCVALRGSVLISGPVHMMALGSRKIRWGQEPISGFEGQRMNRFWIEKKNQ